MNRLFPERKRGLEFACPFAGDQSIKHLVESLGVPHPEVGKVLVNGAPADLAGQIQDGDRIDVYPREIVAEYLSLPRFVVDVNLGKLATYLRMLGFDTATVPGAEDSALARIASQEERILLTRDRGLLKRKVVEKGYCVVADQPASQLRDVLANFHLTGLVRPFQRCLNCNGQLQPVDKEAIQERLLEDTRRRFQAFWICPSCGKVYWQGSHYERMQAFIRQVLADSNR